jgi:hypothetical protein
MTSHPAYDDLQIHDQNLLSLPEDDNVMICLRQQIVQPQDSQDQDAEEEPTDQQAIGPSQAGDIGLPTEELPAEVHYLPQPLEPNQDVAREFELACAGQALSDYNTPYVQSMAFTHLFPFANGDVIKKDRQFTVTMTEANKHLVCYSRFKSPGTYLHIPFVEDERWVFWAQNNAEQHLRNSQKLSTLPRTPRTPISPKLSCKR